MYFLYLVIKTSGEELHHKPASNSFSKSAGLKSEFLKTTIFWGYPEFLKT